MLFVAFPHSEVDALYVFRKTSGPQTPQTVDGRFVMLFLCWSQGQIPDHSITYGVQRCRERSVDLSRYPRLCSAFLAIVGLARPARTIVNITDFIPTKKSRCWIQPAYSAIACIVMRGEFEDMLYRCSEVRWASAEEVACQAVSGLQAAWQTCQIISISKPQRRPSTYNHGTALALLCDTALYIMYSANHLCCLSRRNSRI